MVLRIGDVEASIGSPRHAFGSGKSSVSRRASVSGKALLAGARIAKDFAAFHIQAINRVAFAQRQIVVAGSINGNRAWTIERRGLQRTSVRRDAAPPRPGPRFDNPAGRVQAAHAKVQDVADQQDSLGREGNAVRLAELRLQSRSAISRIAFLPGARYRGDDAGLTIDPADYMRRTIAKEEVARFIERDLIGLISQRRGCRSPVAA